MIKEGQQKTVAYWGKYTVEKIVKLAKPVVCYSEEKGKALFNPILVQIEWERPPSDDKHEFWFRYWITFEGEEKYGKFAPMMSEGSLLELLQGGIKREFFSENFLHQLHRTITDKSNSKYGESA